MRVDCDCCSRGGGSLGGFRVRISSCNRFGPFSVAAVLCLVRLVAVPSFESFPSLVLLLSRVHFLHCPLRNLFDTKLSSHFVRCGCVVLHDVRARGPIVNGKCFSKWSREALVFVCLGHGVFVVVVRSPAY